MDAFIVYITFAARPVMLVTARLHDATKERDLDAITKFIIYILVCYFKIM